MKFNPGDKVICLDTKQINGKEVILTFKSYLGDTKALMFIEEHVAAWHTHRFISAIPYLNEQKLKAALGLNGEDREEKSFGT